MPVALMKAWNVSIIPKVEILREIDFRVTFVSTVYRQLQGNISDYHFLILNSRLHALKCFHNDIKECIPFVLSPGTLKPPRLAQLPPEITYSCPFVILLMNPIHGTHCTRFNKIVS